MSVQETLAARADLGRAAASRGVRVATHRRLKRALDLAVALTAFIVALPLLAAIALVIKADSEGPVFFRQRRSGLGGKPFDILKFRTMHVLENGNDVRQAVANDPRVTWIGRFLRAASLDELPQLLNVIKGDMALVGPRPHACAHDAQFAKLIPDYPMRQAVKPGITGWAQIHGFRGPTPTVELLRRRVDLDVWYARNASLALDVKILLRTPRELIHPRNAL